MHTSGIPMKFCFPNNDQVNNAACSSIGDIIIQLRDRSLTLWYVH